MAWWEMDLQTHSVTFERRKAEMLGYSPNQFTKYEDFMALVHPDDYENVMNKMRKHLEGELEKYEVEYRIKNSNGQYMWFHDIGSIVKRDINGKHLLVTGLVLDISVQKLAEEEINHLNETLETKVHQRTIELESSMESLKSFSYTVSHDLRAPLRAIDGFSSILVSQYQDILGNEGNRLMNVIRENAKRMNELISGLLELAKVTNDIIKKSPLDMNYLANRAYQETVKDEDVSRICWFLAVSCG